ncbi:MBL fold metallo-hydrolase [Chloroflexota bacterium]
MKNKSLFFPFLALAISMIVLVSGCGETYTQEDLATADEEGYSEGYDAGYVVGHNEGCDEGYDHGYDEGYDHGLHEGDGEVYAEIYGVGHWEGYGEGYCTGYEACYEYGLSDAIEQESKDTLRVHFIDVGQGDSILIDLRETEILIDGGDRSPGVIQYLDSYVDGAIEAMIATHPDADHIGGLIAVLNIFQVEEIWINGDTSTSGTYSEFMSAVNSEDAQVYVARRGDTIQAGDIILHVLHPDNLGSTTNNNSIVMSLSFGQVDFLFTGDAEQEAEASMLTAGIVPDVEILKVGHHGSRSSSSAQFLDTVKPEIAIYMAGQVNSYGHPHQESIAALAEVHALIYGTDIYGTIIIVTDGEVICPIPSIKPPNFTVTNLTVSPDDVELRETVTISAVVTNSGGSLGSYTAILRINGSEEKRKSIVLDAGESEVVSFIVVEESIGTYVVDVDGLTGTFTVADTMPEPTSECTCYSYTLKRHIPCEQATAICRDGTCSTSTSRRGTCSHHGGVARWIR